MRIFLSIKANTKAFWELLVTPWYVGAFNAFYDLNVHIRRTIKGLNKNKVRERSGSFSLAFYIYANPGQFINVRRLNGQAFSILHREQNTGLHQSIALTLFDIREHWNWLYEIVNSTNPTAWVGFFLHHEKSDILL